MNFKNFVNEPPASSGSNGGIISPDIFSLARQSSVYSLTFDEFQSTRGGSIVGSMNMDELLKNIWTVEETNHQIQGSTSTLPQEGFLTLPRTLSKKTVDEVWKDLNYNENSNLPLRQQTLGEVTLEEFLVKAGVVRELNTPKLPDKPQNFDLLGDLTRPVITDPISGTSNLVPSFKELNTKLPEKPQNFDLLGDLITPVITNPISGISNLVPSFKGNLVQTGGFGTIGTVDTLSPSVYSDGFGRTDNYNEDNLLVSPVPYVFTGGLRGRRGNKAVEKVIERRQRRMIKNRESAARSRARKQAYTMELEAEIEKLKRENQELLNKQAEIMERQKNQILVKSTKQQGGKRRRLKRTHTGPW